jgi:F-type H+-transporting ATPase subunit gamma
LIGKKGIGFFKFIGRERASQRLDIGDRPTPEHAAELVEPLVAQFVAGEIDAVEVVYAKYVSPITTPATLLPVLPILPPTDRRTDGQTDRKSTTPPGPSVKPSVANYILKPGPTEILEAILPLYVRNMVFRALVETAASEQGARRTAMKNATDNAGDMIDMLRRTYNRARQAQITQEIAEIVGGAEALEG